MSVDIEKPRFAAVEPGGSAIKARITDYANVVVSDNDSSRLICELSLAYQDLSKHIHVASHHPLIELILSWPNPVNTPSASAILLNRSLHHQTLGHEQVRVCVGFPQIHGHIVKPV